MILFDQLVERALGEMLHLLVNRQIDIRAGLRLDIDRAAAVNFVAASVL